MTRRVHRLFLPLTFPFGVAPGEGSDYNLLTIARSGVGEDAKPILRGTALAGALRHAWRKRQESMALSNLDQLERTLFGFALDDESESGDSRLQVGDTPLVLGKGQTLIKTHHLRNRHTGAVADQGLFAMEACPPGTRAEVTLWLRDEDNSADVSREFLAVLLEILESGLTLGGNAARGIGIVHLERPGVVYRCYELADPDDHATYLDEHRAWRLDRRARPVTAQALEAKVHSPAKTLKVRFSLGIPRGQDLLIGDGQGLDHEIEPQRVRAADGKLYWRLPGASLRGLFRGWVARLAAKEGLPVADRAERQKLIYHGEELPKHERLTGDNLGWCFLPSNERKPGVAASDCPVADLFGSLIRAGRVFISDAYAPCSSEEDVQPPEEQTRMHVTVDLVTGGAAEGMLFDNTVLTAYREGQSPRFGVKMRIENPTADEARWLAATLQALDLGVLRVGSSKSSGRLSLVEKPTASGPQEDAFASIQPFPSRQDVSSRKPVRSRFEPEIKGFPTGKTEKGRLERTKKSFRVLLPSKKGMTWYNIPAKAQRFDPEAVEDGMEVDVVRDRQNLIVRVTIPGQLETPPPARHKMPPGRAHGSGSEAVRWLQKASPKAIGMPFWNPFTFLPFPEKEPSRKPPTPLSSDELSGEKTQRWTGVLELEVETKSPLLTCHPTEVEKEHEHKTYKALAIGPDIIVPATGVRGALRSLLTILTGGTLGYLNRYAYLCQGRDTNLGPQGTDRPNGTPENVFLAEVVKPGTEYKAGLVQLGIKRLPLAKDLRRVLNGNPALKRKCKDYSYGNDDPLPRRIRPDKKPAIFHLWARLGVDRKVEELSDTPGNFAEAWKVKVSGRPVGGKDRLEFKREAIFLATPDKKLSLPAELWGAYSGRNIHGDRPTLKEGDLIWLEAKDPDKGIERAEDVKSLQWARLGKTGQPLGSQLPLKILPDYMAKDGLVDPVTALFGQVSPDRDETAPKFAGRIRPENLVFFDAATTVQEAVDLAPLMPPHPGCIAFYRDNPDPDDIGERDALRGYKVYRTTRERGPEAPWRYEVQGVYGKRAELLKASEQKVSKTCDLLPEGARGKLRIAFRALNARELALLMLACSVSWRLGGGKPLGLGVCEAWVTGLFGDDGQTLQIPGWSIGPDSDGAFKVEGWQTLVKDFAQRVGWWEASQQPVSKLRYPRAVERTGQRLTRGGHTWFGRHAAPRFPPAAGPREPGLGPLYIDGELLRQVDEAGEPMDPDQKMVAAQVLPPFDPTSTDSDALYGYDAFGRSVDRGKPKKRVYLKLEEFDPKRHVTGHEQSQGNQGKNAQFRKAQKRGRSEGE